MASMAGVDQLTPMDPNFWKTRFQAVLNRIIDSASHYNDDYVGTCDDGTCVVSTCDDGTCVVSTCDGGTCDGGTCDGCTCDGGTYERMQAVAHSWLDPRGFGDDDDYYDDDDDDDADSRIQAEADRWAHLHGYDDQLDAPVWNGDDDDSDDGYDSEGFYFR